MQTVWLSPRGRSQALCGKDDQRAALVPSVRQELRQRYSVSKKTDFPTLHELSRLMSLDFRGVVLRENSVLISLGLWVSGLRASGTKILLMMAVVQSLNMVIFAWFNRVVVLPILVLRQQLTVYKRKSNKPMLRNKDRLFFPIKHLNLRSPPWASTSASSKQLLQAATRVEGNNLVASRAVGFCVKRQSARWSGQARGLEKPVSPDFGDAGGLDDPWQQQLAMPVYDKVLDSAGVRRALAEAQKERTSQWRAKVSSPGSFAQRA